MKILLAKQIYQTDQATIKNKSISSTELMEQAGIKAFEWIITNVHANDTIFNIFCGIGNNGGDGLVIARKLLEANYHVKTFIVNFSKNKSSDFQINFDRLVKLDHTLMELDKIEDFPKLSSHDIVIDALFGQNYTAIEACILGVYIHGRTADIAVNTNESKESFIASDCVNYFGVVFKEISIMA